MPENYSESLLEKYLDINEKFQNLEAVEFIDTNALEIMLNNFQRDDNGNLKITNNNIVPGACDVLPLYVDLKDEKLKDYLYNSAREILKELTDNNIKIFWTPKETYHISMSLLQDLRPCDMADEKLLDSRLSVDQIKETTKQIKTIVEDTPSFKLRLYGLSIGRGGSLTALFIDNGQYLELQQKIDNKLNSISFIPVRKYKKDMVHMTLARILEPVSEESFLNIKEKIKSYYNLLDSAQYLEVNGIILAHEIQWMHEKIEPGSEIELKLK